MKVKISDVAREAGVSKATVSLALNGSEKVNKRTKERVTEIARSMGYTPNPYARRLVTKKSSLIGLIVPDIENVYYASLVHHLSSALQSSGYSLFLSTSGNSRLNERKLVSEMIDNRMDALFLVPVNKPNTDLSYLDMLTDAGIPTLFLTSKYPGIEKPCLMSDLYDGMKRMIGELHAKGCRKITLISGLDGVYCLDLRTQGYLDAMREYKLRYENILHLDPVTYENAYELIKQSAALDSDAIVCINDMMALGVVNALIDMGLRVPGDIAVAGYDDVIYSQVSPVPITTVRQDIARIAREAAAMILKMIDGEGPDGAQQTLLPCEIVVKQSTP